MSIPKSVSSVLPIAVSALSIAGTGPCEAILFNNINNSSATSFEIWLIYSINSFNGLLIVEFNNFSKSIWVIFKTYNVPSNSIIPRISLALE